MATVKRYSTLAGGSSKNPSNFTLLLPSCGAQWLGEGRLDICFGGVLGSGFAIWCFCYHYHEDDAILGNSLGFLHGNDKILGSSLGLLLENDKILGSSLGLLQGNDNILGLPLGLIPGK